VSIILSQFIKQTLFIFFLCTSLAYGVEVIESYDNSTLPVLNNELRAIEADVREFRASIVPPGVITQYISATPPSGWLICDGTAVSRSKYALLYVVIGTTYGVGDGSTTFNLPDFKGRVAVGRDVSDGKFDVMGETGGEETHTLNITEMPRHRHGIAQGSTIAGGGGSDDVWAGTSRYSTYEGGDGAHNNLQPYIITTFIIKY
jgi:microcystin-dependent protein